MVIYVVIDTDGELDGAYSSYEKAYNSLKRKREPAQYQIFATLLDE